MLLHSSIHIHHSMNPKALIKLELNHYNSFGSIGGNTPEASVSCGNVYPVAALMPTVAKMEPTLKDEAQQPINNEGNDKEKDGEEEDGEQLFTQLVQSARWECPCGQKVDGPIEYFQHVKQSHQYDTLEQLLQQKTLKKVIELYPKVSRQDIDIIQQLDTTSITQTLQQISDKHQKALKEVPLAVVEPGGRGTFGDLASRFLEEIGKESPEGAILRIFFSFLQEYVSRSMGISAWSQESPGELLRSSNKIFCYFVLECQGRYQPLQQEDVKKLIYLLSKWMFLNRWTNDRIFPVPEQSKKEQQEIEND